MKKSVLAAAIFGAAVAGAAILGSQFTPQGNRREWYESLEKPPFNPPDLAFPIAWTTLYTLIAISGFRVWRTEKGSERTRALALWTTQLALNAAWSPIFFGARTDGSAPAVRLNDPLPPGATKLTIQPISMPDRKSVV